MPNEKGYMDKSFCLDCLPKHSNYAEHHASDFVTGTKDEPELRAKAIEILDKIRDMRKEIDDIRVNELAKERLRQTL